MFRNIYTGSQLTARFFTDELKAVFQDRGALLILLIALVIYPVIYGIAYKNEVVRNIPVVVVDLDNTASSRQLVRMIDASEQLVVASGVGSLADAKAQFYQGEVSGVVLIPNDFERKLMTSGQTTVSVYSDAAYFMMYKQTLSGVLRASATFGAGVEIKRILAKGVPMEQAMARRDPVALQSVMLFNPAGGYNSFVIPGLLIVILQQTLLIGIGLLGGSERERRRRRFTIPGTLHSGAVMPVLFGKAGAYFFIYLINVVITQVWVYHWFALPSKGELLPVMALMVPFLLAVTFMGLAVSTFFSRREHSIIFMVFLSPLALFLSGLSWPASAIPTWLNGLAKLFPSTTMVPALLQVRTMGAGLNHVAGAFYTLSLQAVLYALLALVLFYIAAKRNKA